MKVFFAIMMVVGLLERADLALTAMTTNAEFTHIGVLWLILATVGAIGYQGRETK